MQIPGPALGTRVHAQVQSFYLRFYNLKAPSLYPV